MPMNFQRKNPTTISSWARSIAQTLEKEGYDSKAILKEAGIDEKITLNPDKRIKLTKMSVLWDLALKKTGDQSFGLSVAENIHHGTFHALGYALMASTNLYDAFKRAQNFYRIISNAVEVKLIEEKEYISINFIPLDGPKPSIPAMDSFFAGIILFSRDMMKTSTQNMKIEMIRPEPKNIERYHEIFGENIIFSSIQNRFLFDKTNLKIPLPAANTEIAGYNDKIIVDYLEQFDQANIASKVHKKIIDLLPIGEPSLEILAKKIGMSKRSLNRYLKNEDVTYRDMLKEIRQHLAEKYLLENRYSIIEIAFKLGYTDSSNFSRAFKRWVGVTPKGYRNGERCVKKGLT
ncbi:MAG: AraC family transcriptional regulator [Desulfobacterales bacterium]|nr:AraC family transcriptional regulator [Desulfobacterales bacterium]